jgi:hypothetical protein
MIEYARWTGISGQAYNFEVFRDGVEFNPVSGVYILSKVAIASAGRRRFEALYVGEAQSLKDRLNASAINHDGLKRSRQSGMTHIAVYRCDGAAERLRIETDLRHALSPVCNRQPVPNLTGLFTTRG